jgi:hypothetical protein
MPSETGHRRRSSSPARGVLIAPLGFSSITRNGNARASFFQEPAHVEKDGFPHSLFPLKCHTTKARTLTYLPVGG